MIKFLFKQLLRAMPMLSDFKDFIEAILKKWIFWLFILINAVSFIVQYVNPNFSLNPVYNIVFALVGFIWASFQVYKDLLTSYQKITQVKTPIPPKSELSVSFVEGNEYAFSISDPYTDKALFIERLLGQEKTRCHYDETGVFFIDGKPYYVLTAGWLNINVRIENSGDLSMDILSIKSNNSLDRRDVFIYENTKSIDDKEVGYPFHLRNGDIHILKYKHKFKEGLSTTEAEFAAAFRTLPKSVTCLISFDTIDINGDRKKYDVKIATSLRPMIDLYINQWRQYYQEDLLRVAGFPNNKS